GIPSSDGCDRAPEHIRVLRIPGGEQPVCRRGNADGLETGGGQQVHGTRQTANVGGPQRGRRRRPEQRRRRLLGGPARLGGSTEVPALVVVDRVGPAIEGWRSMRTETRGVVIAERRDELEERRLRIRECGWSRVP